MPDTSETRLALRTPDFAPSPPAPISTQKGTETMPAQLLGKPKEKIDQERIIVALERIDAHLGMIARNLQALVKALPPSPG